MDSLSLQFGPRSIKKKIFSAAIVLLSATLPAVVRADTQPPTHEERALLVLVNEARMRESLPPLVWNDDLAEAAHAHSDDMVENGCFQHDSCDGTNWAVRVRSYYADATALGENIGGAGTALVAHNGFMASAPHRAQILSSRFTEFGAGIGLGVWDYGIYGLTTEDFGSRGPIEIPPIPGATVLPRTSNAGEARWLVLNYYDEANRAPDRVAATLGSECVELERYSGRAARGTFATTAPVDGNGCLPLVFEVTTSTGSLHRFPETGAILVGAGTRGDACAERTAATPPSRCGGGPLPSPTPTPEPGGAVPLTSLSLALRPRRSDPSEGQIRARATFSTAAEIDPTSAPIRISITYAEGQSWSQVLPASCGGEPCLRSNARGTSFRGFYSPPDLALNLVQAQPGSWRISFSARNAQLGPLSDGDMTLRVEIGGVEVFGATTGFLGDGGNLIGR